VQNLHADAKGYRGGQRRPLGVRQALDRAQRRTIDVFADHGNFTVDCNDVEHRGELGVPHAASDPGGVEHALCIVQPAGRHRDSPHTNQPPLVASRSHTRCEQRPERTLAELGHQLVRPNSFERRRLGSR
jgi:hypothetical protein